MRFFLLFGPLLFTNILSGTLGHSQYQTAEIRVLKMIDMFQRDINCTVFFIRDILSMNKLKRWFWNSGNAFNMSLIAKKPARRSRDNHVNISLHCLYYVAGDPSGQPL